LLSGKTLPSLKLRPKRLKKKINYLSKSQLLKLIKVSINKNNCEHLTYDLGRLKLIEKRDTRKRTFTLKVRLFNY
jgi:superfamily II RNA helicase